MDMVDRRIILKKRKNGQEIFILKDDLNREEQLFLDHLQKETEKQDVSLWRLLTRSRFQNYGNALTYFHCRYAQAKLAPEFFSSGHFKGSQYLHLCILPQEEAWS